MPREFIHFCAPDPAGRSSACCTLIDGCVYAGIASGPGHAKAVSTLSSLLEASRTDHFTWSSARARAVWELLVPLLAPGARAALLFSDPDNTQYKTLFMHGYANEGPWYEARMGMLSGGVKYLNLDLEKSPPSLRPIMGDNHCSDADDQMYVLCAAPFEINSGTKSTLGAAVKEAFLTLCVPSPAKRMEDAAKCLRGVLPEGALVLAVDPGPAIARAPVSSIPEDSAEGVLKITEAACTEKLYGGSTQVRRTSATFPVKTGPVGYPGLDIVVLEISSASLELLVDGRRRMVLERGGKVAYHQEFDGYEDHEGVVWETDNYDYTISWKV